MLTGGAEKVLRIFDLGRPDASPTEIEGSPGSIRTAVWLHSDQSLLSSCSDAGGVRYELQPFFVRACFMARKNTQRVGYA